ncbi:hypothetical protein FQR65_LT01888 [Abscondita terminalis]|nr:hypothetical protein FQR65_LT01888 [Abscondita terminalis]
MIANTSPEVGNGVRYIEYLSDANADTVVSNQAMEEEDFAPNHIKQGPASETSSPTFLRLFKNCGDSFEVILQDIELKAFGKLFSCNLTLKVNQAEFG